MIGRAICLLVAFVVLATEQHAQDVIRVPGNSPLIQASLAERWKWAQDEARTRKFQHGYWVGFSIVRLMEQNSFFGTHFSDSRGLKTLEEILYGTTFQSHKREHDYWDDPSFRYQKVQKDIAVLFRFQPHVSAAGKPEKVAASNIGLSFDQMDFPIIWLGGAKNEQSVELLVDQYKASTSIDVKSTMLGIVGWHEQSQKAYGLLRSVLTGSEAEELRKKAALHLGEFEDAETLELLEETAESDRSTEVAERAVLGIARMDGDAAIDALIGLAKNAKRDGVRKKAVQSLTRYASEKIVPTLQDIVLNDKDLELQKQAVYALSRMKREDYIPQLITLAKTHSHAEIRKYAIHMLGQSKDQRALDALIDLVKQ